MFGFNQPVVPEIEASKVHEALENNEDVIIIDVRTPQEFSRGKIVGSINVPVDLVESKIEESVTDKNKTVYVYCLSGARSNMAVDAMVKKGYSNVYSMTSGLLSWRAKQYPLSA